LKESNRIGGIRAGGTVSFHLRKSALSPPVSLQQVYLSTGCPATGSFDPTAWECRGQGVMDEAQLPFLLTFMHADIVLKCLHHHRKTSVFLNPGVKLFIIILCIILLSLISISSTNKNKSSKYKTI
jgi:hypothetical protein